MILPRPCYVLCRWHDAITSSMHLPRICLRMATCTRHHHQRTPLLPRDTTAGTRRHTHSRTNRHQTVSLCMTVLLRIQESVDPLLCNNRTEDRVDHREWEAVLDGCHHNSNRDRTQAMVTQDNSLDRILVTGIQDSNSLSIPHKEDHSRDTIQVATINSSRAVLPWGPWALIRDLIQAKGDPATIIITVSGGSVIRWLCMFDNGLIMESLSVCHLQMRRVRRQHRRITTRTSRRPLTYPRHQRIM